MTLLKFEIAVASADGVGESDRVWFPKWLRRYAMTFPQQILRPPIFSLGLRKSRRHPSCDSCPAADRLTPRTENPMGSWRAIGDLTQVT